MEERGRNGSKTTGCFQSGSSSHPLKIDVFYVPFVSLYKPCVFVRVLASPVCLSTCCNLSLCVGSTPLRCLSVCLSVRLQLLPFSLWVWPSPFPFVARISVHLFCFVFIPACCLSAASQAGWSTSTQTSMRLLLRRAIKMASFCFSPLGLCEPQPPPVWTFSPSSLTNQSINQNQVSLWW